MADFRIGIDFGGTKIEIAALAKDGSMLLRRRVPNPGTYEAAIIAMGALVQEAEHEQHGTATVGVGIPGAISPDSGLVKNANSVWLNGRPFARDLSEAMSREVRVENDANCFALSEAVDGAGAGQAGGVRHHPGHRGRRRHHRGREGAYRTAPYRRRVGPQPAALAAARRVPDAEMLLRQRGLHRALPVRIRTRGRLRRAGLARRQLHSRPRGGRRGACRGGARPTFRPAGALPRDGDQLPRSGRHRHRRRVVQHGAPVRQGAGDDRALRGQPALHHSDPAQHPRRQPPACAAPPGCGRAKCCART